MTAKDYFLGVLDVRRKIRSLEAQRAEIAEMAMSSGRYSLGGIRAKSGAHSTLEAAVVRLVDKENEISEKIDEYLEKIREAEKVIAKIGNPKYRQVLELRYLSGLRWEHVTEIMGFTDIRWTFRVHGKALLEVEVPAEDH